MSSSQANAIFEIIKAQNTSSIQEVANAVPCSLAEAIRGAEQLKHLGLIRMEDTDDDVSLHVISPSLELNFSKKNEECLAAVSASLADDQTELIAEFEQFQAKINRFVEEDKAPVLSVISSNSQTHHLILLEAAVKQAQTIHIDYNTGYSQEKTSRDIEPQALYLHPTDGWVVIAWCRLRTDYREFRLDRITNLSVLNEHFDSRGFDLMSYFYKLLSPE